MEDTAMAFINVLFFESRLLEMIVYIAREHKVWLLFLGNLK